MKKIRFPGNPYRLGSRALRTAVLTLALMIFAGWAVTAGPVQEQAKETAQSYVFPGESWERIDDPASVGYSAEGLETMREYIKTLDTTGLVAVVGGKILFEYGNIEELSYLASVRKSVLSILYGKYVADGTIRLDLTLEELGIDDVGGLLPIEKKATIDHLITARSGIYHPASNAGDSTADAPARGSQQPGEYFLYNNWDFNCAGYIFEKLTHQVIYDALEHDLARPVGMQDFDRLRQHKSGNLERSKYPAYHIWLSTRDMARIGYLMLREGQWAGRQVVPRDWALKISRVRTPIEEMNPEPYRKGSFGYGYMWWIMGGPRGEGPFKGAYTANGAYGQFIMVLPALDMVVAHKTAVPPYDRSVNSGDFMGIVGRIVAARTGE